ncbi:DUF1330 domain-containing protein [Streptomyces gamaensis]|uniref:DUF1330 domain-containing protein n=1 Tax=Streptomyces gamaensis TaxID=1763542 RepID=A0ABW0Z1S6_9ACTN
MPAYSIAVLRPTFPLHEDALTYVERVQATFEPYGGRFLVHGEPGEWIEGEALGFVVVVEFPDLARARAWYRSPAYQELLPLRTRHIPGSLLFVEGVGPDYDAARTAAAFRAAAAGGSADGA